MSASHRRSHAAFRVFALAICIALAGRSLPAQTSTSASTRAAAIDATVRRAVIDTLASHLRRHYVDADTGELIARHMESRLAAGAYNAITSAARFAEVLTVDLRAVNDDRHLNVTYNPETPGQRPGPEGIRMGSAPPPPPNPTVPPPGSVPDPVRRTNYGLGRVDVLAGNVGYLDIRGFSGARLVERAIVGALMYLEGTDAIILDLRRNGGGSPYSVNLIISHFTTSDTVASLTVRNRSGNQTFTRYTLPAVSGPRRPTVPLYVLTSGATASAGEDFAFVLKNMRRATIVGGTTAGAGHNNANLALGNGFNASVSFTRVVDPKTDAEWERVGVKPDVPVDQAKALEVAHALALKNIAAALTSDPRRRHIVDLTRETVEAESSPRTVPASALSAYAGEYDGGRTIAVERGRLTYSPRRGFPPETIVPLSDSTFAFGTNRLAFERADGGRYRLRITPPEGEPLTYERVKP